MNRSSVFALGLLFSSTACLGQTASSASSDSPTLQALLQEVRGLRQDMQVTFIAAQRAQILIYRLQGQEAVVARASQRLDEARDKLARTQDDRKHLASEVKQNEDFIANTENPEAQRKLFEDRLPLLKTRLEALESDEQQRQSQEMEGEQQLRTEEARLGELRDELDRLDKSLENASRRIGGASQ
jgi:chromosome segregation ATPase